MALVEQTVNIKVMDSGIEPRLYMVQADTGRSIRCIIQDWNIPDNATAKVYVRKISGKVVYNTCEVEPETNSVIIAVTSQMIAEAGADNLAMVEITSGDECVTTFAFFLVVKDKIGGGEESKNESTWIEEIMQEYIDKAEGLVKEAENAVEEADGMADAAKQAAEDAAESAQKAGDASDAAEDAADRAEEAAEGAAQSEANAESSAEEAKTAAEQAAEKAAEEAAEKAAEKLRLDLINDDEKSESTTYSSEKIEALLEEHGGSGGKLIDDSKASGSTTYSSEKIELIREDLADELDEVNSEVSNLKESIENIKGLVVEEYISLEGFNITANGTVTMDLALPEKEGYQAVASICSSTGNQYLYVQACRIVNGVINVSVHSTSSSVLPVVEQRFYIFWEKV